MSKTDVAPWCYKWTNGLDWMDRSPGGVKYRAPYGANKDLPQKHNFVPDTK